MPHTAGNQRYQRVLNWVLLIGVAGIAVSWLVYAFVGHRVVEHAYRSGSQLVRYVMAGRSDTPLQTYVDRADTLMLVATFWAIPLLALAAAFKRPMALLKGVVSLAVVAVVAVVALEAKPQLAQIVGLDSVDYYFYRNTLLPDADLVFRSKPLVRNHVNESNDARLYGIDTVPTLSEWATDEEGFRNARAAASCDVVLFGDGMVSSGRTLSETFGSRVEHHLRRCVANLGVSGYSPFQYISAFERYGIPKRPTHAVLAFNEGNDVQDIEKYTAWKAGSPKSFWGGYEVAISSPVVRLRVAAGQTLNYVRGRLWQRAARAIFAHSGTAHPLVGDLAWVRLPNQAVFPMVFVDRVPTENADAIQRTENWQQIRTLLSRFRALCVQHNITPSILFVPTAAHIYAQYSTDRSGREWLLVRDEQVRAKDNLEVAVARLSAELGIPFISLTAPFEAAAQNGAALYDSFSVHLTAQGADIGGRHVAAALAALGDRSRDAQRLMTPSRRPQGHDGVDSLSAKPDISRSRM